MASSYNNFQAEEKKEDEVRLDKLEVLVERLSIDLQVCRLDLRNTKEELSACQSSHSKLSHQVIALNADLQAAENERHELETATEKNTKEQLQQLQSQMLELVANLTNLQENAQKESHDLLGACTANRLAIGKGKQQLTSLALDVAALQQQAKPLHIARIQTTTEVKELSKVVRTVSADWMEQRRAAALASQKAAAAASCVSERLSAAERSLSAVGALAEHVAEHALKDLEAALTKKWSQHATELVGQQRAVLQRLDHVQHSLLPKVAQEGQRAMEGVSDQLQSELQQQQRTLEKQLQGAAVSTSEQLGLQAENHNTKLLKMEVFLQDQLDHCQSRLGELADLLHAVASEPKVDEQQLCERLLEKVAGQLQRAKEDSSRRQEELAALHQQDIGNAVQKMEKKLVQYTAGRAKEHDTLTTHITALGARYDELAQTTETTNEELEAHALHTKEWGQQLQATLQESFAAQLDALEKQLSHQSTITTDAVVSVAKQDWTTERQALEASIQSQLESTVTKVMLATKREIDELAQAVELTKTEFEAQAKHTKEWGQQLQATLQDSFKAHMETLKKELSHIGTVTVDAAVSVAQKDWEKELQASQARFQRELDSTVTKVNATKFETRQQLQAIQESFKVQLEALVQGRQKTTDREAKELQALQTSLKFQLERLEAQELQAIREKTEKETLDEEQDRSKKVSFSKELEVDAAVQVKSSTKNECPSPSALRAATIPANDALAAANAKLAESLAAQEKLESANAKLRESHWENRGLKRVMELMKKENAKYKEQQQQQQQQEIIVDGKASPQSLSEHNDHATSQPTPPSPVMIEDVASPSKERVDTETELSEMEREI